jgi:hypothetical protein
LLDVGFGHGGVGGLADDDAGVAAPGGLGEQDAAVFGGGEKAELAGDDAPGCGAGELFAEPSDELFAPFRVATDDPAGGLPEGAIAFGEEREDVPGLETAALDLVEGNQGGPAAGGIVGRKGRTERGGIPDLDEGEDEGVQELGFGRARGGIEQAVNGFGVAESAEAFGGRRTEASAGVFFST